MKEYRTVDKRKIYRLINTGPLVLVSTMSKAGIHNIAPVAWKCPLEMDPPRILLCLAPEHRTSANIIATGKFVVSIPHISQKELVEKTGAVSGKKTRKFEAFEIKSFEAGKTRCLVPEGVIAYIECRLIRTMDIRGTLVAAAEAVCAAADKKAFNHGRLLAERAAGKAIHHLGGGRFTTYGKVSL